MSEVVDINIKSRARNEASIWLVRLQEGLDQPQRQALEAWLDQDPSHQVQLLELAAIWDEMEVLTELAPLFEDVAVRANADRKLGTRPATTWRNTGIAASVFVAVAVSVFVFNQYATISDPRPQITTEQAKPSEVESSRLAAQQKNQFETPIGKQLEVRLNDGTMATLNTDTQIRINFTAERRTINLIRGEAHFDVFRDPDRPLVVMASGKSIEAVGTAFSVRKTNATEIEVAVDKGRVAVYQLDSSDDQSALHEVPRLTASLDAGEVLTIVENQHQLAQYDTDEMLDRLAWRQGMIVINDKTLDYVINEFSRYSEQRMLLADRKMGETRVAGYFRLGDIDALLVALEENFNIRSEYYQQNDTFVLSQL